MLFLKTWLMPFVTEVHPRGRNMKPFDAEEVLSDVRGLDVTDVDELVKSILEPLCAGGLLHALGVPGNRDGRFDRYPGPYLPRPTFLLHAYAGGEDWPMAPA
jgi:hypothetical protein